MVRQVSSASTTLSGRPQSQEMFYSQNMNQQNPCVAWTMGVLASTSMGVKETWEVSYVVSGNLHSFELLPLSHYT